MSQSTLSLRQDGAILRVAVSNPPINLFSAKMVGELFQLSGRLAADDSVRVVIFESANPEFFIAHFDLNDVVSATDDPAAAGRYPDINSLQALGLCWQALPQVTIAKVSSRCRGGGLEFIMALNMRFAALDAQFCSPEAPGGFIACGGGATRIAMAAGPSRALEFLLTGRDFSGEEAERYGLVNRALPTGELDGYVDKVASLVARNSPAVIAMHREVFARVFSPVPALTFAAFAAENDSLRKAASGTEMLDKMRAMIKLKQAREVELDLPATMERVNASIS